MNPSRRTLLKLTLLAVFAAVIALAVVEGLFWWRHVTVTDARVETDFTLMASSVNARVDAVAVRRGDTVNAGDRLVAMDAEVAALDAVSIDADLAKIKAKKAQVMAELAAFRQENADRIATLETVLDRQALEYKTLSRRRSIAAETAQRNAELLRKGVIPKRVDDVARDTLLGVVSSVQDLDTRIAENRRKIEEVRGKAMQEPVFQSRIYVLDREAKILAVKLRQAQRNLHKMDIYAPIDGVVSEVFVNPGAYVEDGDRVVLLHDPTKLWIMAPVDAAQVRDIAVGQPAEVQIEAYRYDGFEGRVVDIGRVTVGSIDDSQETGRAPPRIPVIIELAPTDRPLWPGMRATVNIMIR